MITMVSPSGGIWQCPAKAVVGWETLGHRRIVSVDDPPVPGDPPPDITNLEDEKADGDEPSVVSLADDPDKQ